MSPVPHTTATILWTSLSEGYYSLLVWFVFLLLSFMSWWVDEKMKTSMGLLLWLIIQARVTAVSVIKPVMMIWFHQAGRTKKIHLFQWVKVVSQRISALSVCFIVGFLTEHARGLSSFPTLDTEDMEAQSMAFPQKPLWPWSEVWGQTAREKQDPPSPLVSEALRTKLISAFSKQTLDFSTSLLVAETCWWHRVLRTFTPWSWHQRRAEDPSLVSLFSDWILMQILWLFKHWREKTGL